MANTSKHELASATASRRSSKLFWSLFLPLTLLLWATVGMMVWYAIANEKRVRRDLIETQIRNVNATILDAHEQGSDLQATLDFIDDYTDNTNFNQLRVSVYDAQGNVVAHVGAVIPLADDSLRLPPELLPEPDPARPAILNAMTSNDGQIQTIASVVYTPSLARALTYSPLIWTIVVALAVIATAAIYMIARRMERAAAALRDFASRAAAGELLDGDDDATPFSHDELGDAAREIVRLYRDKDRINRRLEHEHQVALRANEEKARIKRQTANNLNHELKTPVGVIKGYIDTILADPDMPAALRSSFLRKAQEHADRLTKLLKDVSSITRLDEGAQQVETTVFDFHDLAYNIAADLEASDLNEGMDFDWDVPFDTFVTGNWTLLTNAILNLIHNAAKYSGGTVISLRLLSTDSQTATFAFADNGAGVDPEHLPHLFERFYRVDEGRARKSGGTGLGLPIVKSTFAALGGDISVGPAEPHGLQFIFTLPSAKPLESTPS